MTMSFGLISSLPFLIDCGCRDAWYNNIPITYLTETPNLVYMKLIIRQYILHEYLIEWMVRVIVNKRKNKEAVFY